MELAAGGVDGKAASSRGSNVNCADPGVSGITIARLEQLLCGDLMILLFKLLTLLLSKL
jgi:hypothetical protein